MGGCGQVEDPASTGDAKDDHLSAARIWPCRTCGILLGISHLLLGIILLIFDIFTNNISETAFAITAALAFIICALFAFIAARRLDRPAQLLLLFFSLFAFAMSAAMFIESAAIINYNCDHNKCHRRENIIHIILLCFALTE
uniref:MARVEL domain-containing protein n=1 Tax=Parascaris equorum TaxID=6256 RepID=A0A914S7R2_PAREQ